MTERPSQRQARLTWWLLAAPAATAGLLATAAATATFAVRLHLPSADRLVDACRSLIPPIGLRPLIELFAAGLGFIAIARAAALALGELGGLRRYHNSVRDSRRARIGATDVWIVDDARPLAFTGGWLQPRIHVSTTTVRRLEDDELAAVVAHEDRHRRHRDPLRLAAARVTAGALPFLPPVRVLAGRHAGALELAADEHAANTFGTQALAGALLRLGTADDERGEVCRIAPDRVDQLAGRPTARLGLRQTVLLSLTALALSLISLESIETARSARIDVALAAAQFCTVGPVAVAFVVLAHASRRQSGQAPRETQRWASISQAPSS